MDGSKETTTQAKPTAQTKPETESRSSPSQTVSGERSERQGSSTSLSAAAAKKIDSRLFEIWLSIRYHSKRQKHFEILEAGSNFLLLLLGSGAVATAAVPAIPIIGMTIAAITAMKIAFGPAYRAARHERLIESFTELESKLLSSKNDEEVDQIIGEILKLEAKEPPVLINLSIICYNEVAISKGRETARSLSGWQGFMARWMDWRPYQDQAIKS